MSSRFGAYMSGKRRAERRDDLAGLVDRQRRLRHVRDLRGVELERIDVGDRFDEDDRVRRLAHRADHLFVAGVSDQHDRVTLGRVPPRLHVHLRDEWARRVDRLEPPCGGVRVNRRCDAVGGEHDGRALRNLGLLVDEDGAACLEVADDVEVVDDLLADVDRRPVEVERLLDRVDRALDPGAVAARGRRRTFLTTGSG